MDRRALLVTVAAVAVVSSLLGWVGGQRIKSPAEIAAETDAPEPSLISVPVENRLLSQQVVVRGTVRSSDATELTVSGASGNSLVVTRLPKAAGDPVGEGDVAIEVSGRPIIVLQGDLPVFRNLIPTLDGPDVRQLEEALNRLRLDPGQVDGVYDRSTAAAVERLYRKAGYTPPVQDVAEQTAVTTAKEAVAAAEDELDVANKALADARAPLKESEKLQLDQSVVQAQNAVTSAKAASATAKADAAQAVTDADSAKQAADKASAAAADKLAKAKAGTNPDTGEPPTPAELAALQTAADEAVAAASDAATKLTRAQAAVPTVNQEQDALVAAAEAAVPVAEAQRRERLAPADTAGLSSAVTDAQKRVADAKTALTTAESKAGAEIPVAELVFLPSLPQEVQSVAVEVGDTPTGAVMTISGSKTLVESGLSSADRRLVEVGAEAVLEDQGLGLEVPAVVTFVADKPGGADLSADRYGLRLEPVEPLPEDALNLNLRVSIPISSSGGEVLAVPLAALSAGADGSARVEVERSAGQVELVEVVTGLRADGYVEVRSAAGAPALAVGDRVVVGRDLELPGQAGAGAAAGDEENPTTSDSERDTGS
ncbi:MAG: peptidoglycan-binding domain-containing protein [Acidimicrobiales bacterium]